MSFSKQTSDFHGSAQSYDLCSRSREENVDDPSFYSGNEGASTSTSYETGASGFSTSVSTKQKSSSTSTSTKTVKKREEQTCQYCFVHTGLKKPIKGHYYCENKHDKTCDICAPIYIRNEKNKKRKKEKYKESNETPEPYEVIRIGPSLQDDKKVKSKIFKDLFSRK